MKKSTASIWSACWRTNSRQEQLAAAAPIHGDWTVKEVLVHLAGWDRAVALSADDVLALRPARLTEMPLEDVNIEGGLPPGVVARACAARADGGAPGPPGPTGRIRGRPSLAIPGRTAAQ